MAAGVQDTARLSSKNLRRQWQREWLTAPPFTPAFEDAKAEFATLLKADDFALFEKVLVWFQAQHTIPSPYILGNIKSPVEGMDNLAVADMLGWPSDFRAWGRLIDWIISEANCHSRPADSENSGGLRRLAECIFRSEKRTIQSHPAIRRRMAACALKMANCAINPMAAKKRRGV